MGNLVLEWIVFTLLTIVPVEYFFVSFVLVAIHCYEQCRKYIQERRKKNIPNTNENVPQQALVNNRDSLISSADKPQWTRTIQQEPPTLNIPQWTRTNEQAPGQQIL